MKKYDLTVAYRIYPKISKVPPIYADDKMKLSELCLASFCESIKGLNVKIIALLDNCPDEYESLFKKYFLDEDLTLMRLPQTGNGNTFKMQIELLLEQKFSEIIYFAEDDYFYFPECISRMLSMMNSEHKPDFLTSFDHLDHYRLALHDYKYEIVKNGVDNWRRIATTCLTFMTTKTKLSATKDVFLTYAKNNYDASVWMTLTKLKLLNPIYNVQILLDRNMTGVILKLWWFGWKGILTGKKFKLYCPLPTLSTHMDSEALPPGINWQSEFNKVAEKIS